MGVLKVRCLGCGALCDCEYEDSSKSKKEILAEIESGSICPQCGGKLAKDEEVIIGTFDLNEPPIEQKFVRSKDGTIDLKLLKAFQGKLFHLIFERDKQILHSGMPGIPVPEDFIFKIYDYMVEFGFLNEKEVEDLNQYISDTGFDY